MRFPMVFQHFALFESLSVDRRGAAFREPHAFFGAVRGLFVRQPGVFARRIAGVLRGHPVGKALAGQTAGDVVSGPERKDVSTLRVHDFRQGRQHHR